MKCDQTEWMHVYRYIKKGNNKEKAVGKSHRKRMSSGWEMQHGYLLNANSVAAALQDMEAAVITGKINYHSYQRFSPILPVFCLLRSQRDGISLKE
ncbi:hypothetical protein CDAR_366521 [Caerostris darwini]|uniref:Uncharacterized protein n=1 Tax=Caerostris darwini TaxID=1538125 RepID=A0AAV4Q8N1_9ARAC|nr:hypothetical protein CDAR_366521 [Caerostris darwini]